MKEHLCPVNPNTPQAQISSVVALHSIQAHGKQPILEDWQFIPLLSNILSSQNRKTKEAIFIAKNKPMLNRDMGMTHILSQFV